MDNQISLLAIVQGGFVVLMAVLSFLGVRLHNKVDALEKEKAEKEWVKENLAQFTRTADRLEKKLDNYTREIIRLITREEGDD